MTFQSNVVSTHFYYTAGMLTSLVRGGYISGTDAKQSQYYNLTYDGFGNMNKIAIGNQVLATYDYGSTNQNLKSMTYGNGSAVNYTYDNLDRVILEQTDTTTYEYLYNSEGNLAKKLDKNTGKAVNYEYDSLGRLIRSYQSNGSSVVQQTEHIYDTSNRLSRQSWQLGDTTYGESYTYDADDGALTYIEGSGELPSIAFGYDALKRLSYRFNYYFRQDYTYRDISSGSQTTTQVASIAYSQRPGGTNFSTFTLGYSYDNLGNISKVTGTNNTAQNASYTYDQQGQLITETNNKGSYTYNYDTYGNIRSVSGAESHNYTYGNSEWLDLLTAYDGHAINYDTIGNPTNWYNTKAWNFTWQNGRQLAKATSGSTTVSYTYDVAGIRDSKTVGSTVYNYLTQNGKVVRQTWGSHILDIIYDNQGNPFCCIYDGTTYLYVLNLQGDVIRLVTTTGSTAASYVYDAWGNVISSSGSMASINPIRYRGYYYDTETKLYYLGSRYYDPAVKRFINADNAKLIPSTSGSLSDKNLFAYCNNSPVTLADDNGYLPTVIVGAIVGAGIHLMQSIAKGDSASDTIKSVAIGAISGGIEASLGGVASIAYGAITSAWSTYKDSKEQLSNGTLSVSGTVAKVATSAVVGGLFSASGLGGKTEKMSSLKTVARNIRKVTSNISKKGTVYKCALNAVKTYTKRSGKQLVSSFASSIVSSKSTEFSSWYVGKYVTWATS